jgi:aspartate aminotransferase-like enzyme
MMDPDVTLRELLEAVQARAWDRVDELAEALLQWVEKRGFPPSTIGSPQLGVKWHRTVTTMVCHLAVSKARDARQRRRKASG